MVGDFARKIEQMADEDIAGLVVEALEGIFPQPEGKAVPFPIGLAHSSWASDRWAGGSWSFFPYPPLIQAADSSLSDPESSPPTSNLFPSDRVRYASEAVINGYRGTVHGAYLSGFREAQRVVSLVLKSDS